MSSAERLNAALLEKVGDVDRFLDANPTPWDPETLARFTVLVEYWAAAADAYWTESEARTGVPRPPYATPQIDTITVKSG